MYYVQYFGNDNIRLIVEVEEGFVTSSRAEYLYQSEWKQYAIFSTYNSASLVNIDTDHTSKGSYKHKMFITLATVEAFHTHNEKFNFNQDWSEL